MKATTIFAAVAFTVAAGGAVAQTTNTTGQANTMAPDHSSTMTAPNTMAPHADTMTPPNTMAPDHSSTMTSPMQHNTNAAGGPDNQAVATTSANSMTPAKGSNSFTMKEAHHRLARHGFKQIKDLVKDDDGIWRGTAMKNGASVKVWEDYKGNVGSE